MHSGSDRLSLQPSNPNRLPEMEWCRALSGHVPAPPRRAFGVIVLPVLEKARTAPGDDPLREALSPQSVEVLAHVGLRLAAGWTSKEIATEFNVRPPPFRNVPPPKNTALGSTSGWVDARVRKLRDEMVASVDCDS